MYYDADQWERLLHAPGPVRLPGLRGPHPDQEPAAPHQQLSGRQGGAAGETSTQTETSTQARLQPAQGTPGAR